MPRTHETGYGCCHDADRPGTGDEYVFAHHVEGEGGVSRVAEWIENRCNIVRDGVRQLEGVEAGNRQILRESTRTIDTHADCIATQMTTPGAAVSAVAARDVTLAGNPVTDTQPAYLGAHLHDAAAVLVTDGHGHGNGLLRPGIPLVDVHVSTADGRPGDLDQHI